MAKYRFIGQTGVVNGVTYSKYGEVIELDQAVGDALIAASPPAMILPEEIWETLGITDEELAEWPSTTIHGNAPQVFLDKTLAARLAHQDYRDGLNAESVDAASKAAAAKAPVPLTPAAAKESPVPLAVWAPKATKAVGAEIGFNGITMTAVKAGATGDTPPAFALGNGETTPDGTVIWMASAKSPMPEPIPAKTEPAAKTSAAADEAA